MMQNLIFWMEFAVGCLMILLLPIASAVIVIYGVGRAWKEWE